MGEDETKGDEANKKSAEPYKVSEPTTTTTTTATGNTTTSCSNNGEAPKVNNDAGPTNEEQVLIDAAVRNMEEHAQIDDPVEPPARNARKITRGVVAVDADTDVEIVTFVPMNSKSILSRLFDPDRMQKPELWEHIKLVAPGPADNPPPGRIKWRSKDAVSAYCLKCRIQFTYTTGTSKTISRHMQAYHGFPLKDEKNSIPSTSKRSGSGSTNAPPLKKRKPELDQSAQGLLLLKWIVSSFQPWSIVESSGIKDFISCLSDSFELPSTEGIIQIAMDHGEKVKLDVRRVLKDADGYSLVCQVFRNKDKWYTSVTASFCTASFERKSVCLGVILAKGTRETVGSLLTEYSLSSDKISHVTVTGVGDSKELDLDNSSSCVIYKMDSMLQEACSSHIAVNDVLAQAVSSAGSLLVGSTGFVRSAFTALLALDDPRPDSNWKPDKGQTLIISVLTAFLRPFYDAHETLSGETFSSVGLAIPVVRRIQDVVTKLDVKELAKGCGDSSAISSVEAFCNSLLKAFSDTFAPILGEDLPAMWTIPIDPRLIHMGGLSETEKESVMTILVEKVAERRLATGNEENTEISTGSPQGGLKSKKKGEESSTMGGIFWGDDNGDSYKAGNQTEAAAAYARANVDRYFTAVKSQRRIEDPLAWWNTNQKDFPELGEIARIWLGATAVGPVMDERSRYSEGNVDLLTFLHDNNGMILVV